MKHLYAYNNICYVKNQRSALIQAQRWLGLGQDNVNANGLRLSLALGIAKV